MTKYHFFKQFYYVLLLFIFITSCNGQEKTNTAKDPNTSKPSPAVIKNFKAAPMAPDFDTTLVNISEVFFRILKGIYGLEL
jgi:hypothetical protein